MEIKCIGVGGIGSYFAEHVDRLIESNQLDLNITFYDDDIVELKNILYQNFRSQDIDSTKVEALEDRYLYLSFKNKRVSQKDLDDCDLVLLCADNNLIRREAYENYIKNNIPFIDARSNGRAVGIYTSDTESYLNTLSNSNKSSSCQNPFQIDKGEIEYGNVVIAAILAQKLLNYYRKNRMPDNFTANI